MKKPEWPSAVSVFEVGPRDGLQAEAKILSVDERVRLIRKLMAAGLEDIEIGSFVKADWIPQLQHTDEVLRTLRAGKKSRSARFWAFIPNEFGLRQAIAGGIDGAGFFIATSETFCRKNVNRSQDEILGELKNLVPIAKKNKIKSRVYVSTLVHCPYEGPVAPRRVSTLVDKLADIGFTEIVLSDTTGHANPLSIRKVLDRVLKSHPAKQFALHLHDTRGLALANILEAMKFGVRRFDSSIGGTGGCPYAPGASGNLSTEDLVNMLQGLGLAKKIDIKNLAEAGFYIQSLMGREMPSRVLKTWSHGS